MCRQDTVGAIRFTRSSVQENRRSAPVWRVNETSATGVSRRHRLTSPIKTASFEPPTPRIQLDVSTIARGPTTQSAPGNGGGILVDRSSRHGSSRYKRKSDPVHTWSGLCKGAAPRGAAFLLKLPPIRRRIRSSMKMLLLAIGVACVVSAYG